MGPPPRSAEVVVEVGEWRTAQGHHRDRPGVQSGPDSCEARPLPRAHDLNRKPPQVVEHPIFPT